MPTGRHGLSAAPPREPAAWARPASNTIVGWEALALTPEEFTLPCQTMVWGEGRSTRIPDHGIRQLYVLERLLVMLDDRRNDIYVHIDARTREVDVTR